VISNTYNIQAIEIQDTGKYIISMEGQNHFYDSFLVNDEKLTKGHHPDWVIVNSIPKKLERLVSKHRKLVYYKLKNSELSKVTDYPAMLPLESINKSQTYEDSCVFKEPYHEIGYLYEPHYQEIAAHYEPHNFNLKIILSIKDFPDPFSFEYKARTTDLYRKSDVYTINNSSLVQQELDKMLFAPPLLIHRPVKLKAKDLLNIIRQHVKDNINKDVAVISSDYDFFFDVTKIVPLHKIKKYQVDINQGTKKKQKFIDKEVTNKMEKIIGFCATRKDYERYNGSSLLNDLIGDNAEDLDRKLKELLDSLMEFINTPIVECLHCNAQGYIIKSSASLINKCNEDMGDTPPLCHPYL